MLHSFPKAVCKNSFIKSLINYHNKDGNTLVHYACWKGHINLLKFLIANNFKLDTQTIIGNYPLHRAAYNGHNHIIRYLLINKLV